MEFSNGFDFKLKCSLCFDQLEDYEVCNTFTTDLQKQINEIFPPNLYTFKNLSSSLCDRCHSMIKLFSSYRKEIIRKQKEMASKWKPMVEVKLENKCSNEIFLDPIEIVENAYYDESEIHELEASPDRNSRSKRRRDLSRKLSDDEQDDSSSNERLEGKVKRKIDLRTQRKLCMSHKDERDIVQRVNALAESGDPQTKTQLIEMASKHVDQSLTWGWVHKFLKRHPDIKLQRRKNQESIASSSTTCTESIETPINSLTTFCEFCGECFENRLLQKHWFLVHNVTKKFDHDSEKEKQQPEEQNDIPAKSRTKTSELSDQINSSKTSKHLKESYRNETHSQVRNRSRDHNISLTKKEGKKIDLRTQKKLCMSHEDERRIVKRIIECAEHGKPKTRNQVVGMASKLCKRILH